MKTHKYLYLYISDDQTEVLLSRSGLVVRPRGFSAPIGKWIKFTNEDFFKQCVFILCGLLDEDPLWHDEDGKSIREADSNKKGMSSTVKKYFKKFKDLGVSKGGAGPPGITITGAKAIDGIRFSFLETESPSEVAEKFKEAMIKCRWWEE
jgi:hypothetical protein